MIYVLRKQVIQLILYDYSRLKMLINSCYKRTQQISKLYKRNYCNCYVKQNAYNIAFEIKDKHDRRTIPSQRFSTSGM